MFKKVGRVIHHERIWSGTTTHTFRAWVGASTLERKQRAVQAGACCGSKLVRAILLFCGVVSVCTTIGIVIVLGRESLLFFGSEAWLPVNPTDVVEGGVTFDTFRLFVNR
ncbi:MAG UNVERIFIED_CONTAM: hypothetical protein LVT10_21320 [Anaerolineae bacterium]